MLTVTDDLIRSVVQEVLGHMKNGAAPKTPTAKSLGVFDDVDSAVAAASLAQQKYERLGMDERKKAVDCVRKICIGKAEQLGQEEFEETKIGRLKHKVEKLIVAGEKTPGVEYLTTRAFSGENGVTLEDFAPFGVVGIITPVTHSLPTLAGNAINLLASGNALVCNPHP